MFQGWELRWMGCSCVVVRTRSFCCSRFGFFIPLKANWGKPYTPVASSSSSFAAALRGVHSEIPCTMAYEKRQIWLVYAGIGMCLLQMHLCMKIYLACKQSCSIVLAFRCVSQHGKHHQEIDTSSSSHLCWLALFVALQRFAPRFERGSLQAISKLTETVPYLLQHSGSRAKHHRGSLRCQSTICAVRIVVFVFESLKDLKAKKAVQECVLVIKVSYGSLASQ